MTSAGRPNPEALGASPLALASPSALRRELIELVVGELCGPAGGADEILSGRRRPRDRYLAGAVAPTGVRLEPEREETLLPGDDDIQDGGDGDEAGQRSYLPDGRQHFVRLEPPAFRSRQGRLSRQRFVRV